MKVSGAVFKYVERLLPSLCSAQVFHTATSKLRLFQQNDLINQAPPESHSCADKKEVCFNEV